MVSYTRGKNVIMNIMIASDSFKGTLTSRQITEIFEESFNKYIKDGKLVKVNIADGGEGSIDAFKDYVKGELITLEVTNPHFEKVYASYYFTIDKTAIVEVASCSSLNLAEPNLNPKITTTYGVGEQIVDAKNRGAKKIILCLGGSATNDAMCGALSAIGVKFLNKSNDQFVPTGRTLNEIIKIDDSILEEYKDIEFILMTDCENPTYGLNGAAYIYGPQKGASEKDVIELDSNLVYFSNLCKSLYNKDFSNIPGTGAAGAFGFGAKTFLNAEIKSGIGLLLDYIRFDDLLDDVDIVFTGEGKFDKTSLSGKAISGIINRTVKKNKKVIILSGSISKTVEDIDKEKYNIIGIFSTNRLALDYSKVKEDQRENYKNTLDSLLSILSIK